MHFDERTSPEKSQGATFPNCSADEAAMTGPGLRSGRSSNVSPEDIPYYSEKHGSGKDNDRAQRAHSPTSMRSAPRSAATDGAHIAPASCGDTGKHAGTRGRGQDGADGESGDNRKNPNGSYDGDARCEGGASRRGPRPRRTISSLRVSTGGGGGPPDDPAGGGGGDDDDEWYDDDYHYGEGEDGWYHDDEPSGVDHTKSQRRAVSIDRAREVRRAEAAKVEFFAWPTALSFRNWWTAARQAILAASGDPAGCQEWFDSIDSLPLHELQRDGRFSSLSSKVVQGLLTLTRSLGRGPLAERVLRLEEQHMLDRKLLTARVLLRCMKDQLGADPNDASNLDIENIQAVSYNGDLELFLGKWDRVVMNLRSKVDVRLKLHCFLKQFEKSVRTNEDLRFDLLTYKRQVRSSQFESELSQYEYLYDCVRNAIDDARRKNTVVADSSNLRGSMLSFKPDCKPVDLAAASTGLGGRGKGGIPEGCPKGHCFDYFTKGVSLGQNNGDCNFKHELKGKAKGKGKGKGKGKDNGGNEADGMAGGSKTGREKGAQCGFFAAGRCKKGDKCDFVHGENDTRPMPGA